MFTQVKRQPTIEFKLFPETTPEQPVNPSSATDNISHNDSWTTEVVYPYTPIRFTVEGYPYSPVQYSAEHWINLLSIGQAGNGDSQTEVEAPAKPKFSLTPERWVELLSGSRPAKFQ